MQANRLPKPSPALGLSAAATRRTGLCLSSHLKAIFAPGFASPVWPALDLPWTPSRCLPKAQGMAASGTGSSIPSPALMQVLIHVRCCEMLQGKE